MLESTIVSDDKIRENGEGKVLKIPEILDVCQALVRRRINKALMALVNLGLGSNFYPPCSSSFKKLSENI